MVHAQPSSVCGGFFCEIAFTFMKRWEEKGGGPKKTPENGLHVKNRLKQRLQFF